MNFHKYQGTGNDFIMVDQRFRHHIKRGGTERIRQLCDRRFGIGADGLILLQKHPKCDFEMVYFNADGRESSMCGNGGRCIVAFAKQLGLIEGKCRFLAIDGEHEATVRIEDDRPWVELNMNDVKRIETADDSDFVLDTGSPHFVRFFEKIGDCNIVEFGKSVRYDARFSEKGINVNAVVETGNGISVLTYERGVEDETLSCGTGVTAAALAHHFSKNKAKKGHFETQIQAKGGRLAVRFESGGNGQYTDIWLCGPAEKVFEGKIELF